MDKSRSRQDNKFFVIYFVILLAGILIWQNWNKYPVISKRELMKNSTDVLENKLLLITPIGTTVENVKLSIKNDLNRKFTMREKRLGHDFKSEIIEGHYILTSNLASYGWLKNFFCAGTLVDGAWLFDKNKILIEINVRRWGDGM